MVSVASLPLRSTEYVEAIRETRGYVQGVIRNAIPPSLRRNGNFKTECRHKKNYAVKLMTPKQRERLRLNI